MNRKDMNKSRANKFHRLELIRQLEYASLETEIKIKIRKLKEILSAIDSLEEELKNSKEEILKLSNISIEEDLKELIKDRDIPNIKDYRSDLDGEWWYRLEMILDENIREKEKLRKCTIIRFKNEVSLYEFIKTELVGINIKKVKKIKEKKVLSSNDSNISITILKLKEKNKYMLIFKVLSCK